MADTKRGGARAGAGRPKGEETTMVRVPEGCLEAVRALISAYKNQESLPLSDNVDDWHPINELPEPGTRIDLWCVEDDCGICSYNIGATMYLADSIRQAHWTRKITAWRYSTPVSPPLFHRS